MGPAVFLLIVSTGITVALCIAGILYVIFDIVRSDYDDKKKK